MDANSEWLIVRQERKLQKKEKTRLVLHTKITKLYGFSDKRRNI